LYPNRINSLFYEITPVPNALDEDQTYINGLGTAQGSCQYLHNTSIEHNAPNYSNFGTTESSDSASFLTTTPIAAVSHSQPTIPSTIATGQYLDSIFCSPSLLPEGTADYGLVNDFQPAIGFGLEQNLTTVIEPTPLDPSITQANFFDHSQAELPFGAGNDYSALHTLDPVPGNLYNNQDFLQTPESKPSKPQLLVKRFICKTCHATFANQLQYK
jgi:hypothetical protein